MATINLTKGGFERRIASFESIKGEWKFLGSRPAVIDFYASWCGPCKALAPVLEQLSEQFAGKVDIYKVDIDSEQQLAREFEIRSIPTLIFIPQSGQPIRIMGLKSKSELESIISKL